MFTPRTSIKSESGMAIVLVLLALMVVSGLSAAMVASGRTEILISTNHERAAQARAAAEAGLNHALSVVVTYVQNWQANGFASKSAAMTSLIVGPDGDGLATADNGSLVNRADGTITGNLTAPGTRIVLSAAAGTSYETLALDDDAAVRGMAAADHTRLGENNNAVLDANDMIVVRATGYGSGGTTVTLEAIVGPIILPAIVTNDSLTISGNPTIAGANGSVHSNANLTVSGSPNIAQDATASGTYATSGNPSIGGASGGGRPTLTIPSVNAADYLDDAIWVLKSNGWVANRATGVEVCNSQATPAACEDIYGWTFNGVDATTGLAQWHMNDNSPAPTAESSFYIQGDAVMTASPGSGADPLRISIIAEGNINITGNPDLQPFLPEIMLVTNRDLRIAGSLSQPIAFEGQMLVREQLSLSGNPTLAGQILVENAASISNLVTNNTISGNPTIVYNGLVGTNVFQVLGWREIK